MFLPTVKKSFHLRQNISKKLDFFVPAVEVKRLEGLKQVQARSISVITTTLNEEQNIEGWLYALLEQSLSPQEVVICDGGSTDATVNLIKKWKHDHPKLKVILVSSPGANIAKGRNEAMRESTGDVLLFSDVGSVPDKEWVKELSAPFLSDLFATVSLGVSESSSNSSLARAVCKLILPEISEINPATYLASARSIGVSREVFINVGGFPERLTFAGEDTLFNLKIREFTKSGFYFSDKAIAKWIPPKSFLQLWRMLFRYAKGDAEAGNFYREYLSRITELSSIIIGLGLALYCFYYAILRSQFGVLLIVAVAFYFAASPLVAYRNRLKEFGIKEQFLAPFILISAQASGFISGLYSSKE